MKSADSNEMTVRPLDAESWPAFARLVEKHNGVWGGCWCLYFHQKGTGSLEKNKEAKHGLVCEGKARAALVLNGANAVGWCQFGRPEDLPRIYHKKAYDQAVAKHSPFSPPLNSLPATQTIRGNGEPDWRITCFFVDRDCRRRGVAELALEGALDLIAREGGGLVESFPNEVSGKTSASFLHNVTLSLFERMGFERIEKIGMHKWLVVRYVEPNRTR